MGYYFDTSVWPAYLKGREEFYYPEAVKWFKKIEKEKNLYTSMLVEKEIAAKYKRLLKKFKKFRDSLIKQGICKLVNIKKSDVSEAKNIMQSSFYKDLRTEEAFADVLHVVIIKKNKLDAVTADFRHWPYLCRMQGVYWHRITDV